MTRRQKGWIGAVIVLTWALLFGVQTAQAGDWVGYAPISDGQVDVWALRTYGKVGIGPAMSWVDNDADPGEEGDGIGAGIAVTYDLLEDARLALLGREIDVQWFVGAKAQVMYYTASSDLDAAPSLLTGLRFGEPNAGIAVLYEYRLGPDLWSQFATPEGEYRLSISPYWRF